MDDRMEEFVEAGYSLACSRCSFDQFAVPVTDNPDMAADVCVQLRAWGWTVEYPRVLCPQCSGETTR